MTTLENIHDIIDNKIKISSSLFSLLDESLNDCHFKNDDYIFKKNYKNLLENKEIIDNCIDEYQINSAYFIFTYNKLVLLEELESNPESENFINKYSIFLDSIEDSFLKMCSLELINIFKSNSYEYKSNKTIGNKLFLQKSKNNKNRLRNIYDEYKTFVIKSNISDKIDRFVNLIHNFYKVYALNKVSSDEYDCNGSLFLELVGKYNKIYFSLGKEECEIIYDICDCGNKMIIQSNTSELLCIRCGYTVYLIGSVTEENQLFAQEGNRVSHGSYDPARHCKFWIERIQAKESTIIPEEYIEKIRKSIKKDRIDNLKSISVKQFRAYLKQNNLSKLNDHIPLIKKIITGYIPPQLTYNEHQLLFIYFDKATKTYERIKPSNKKNSLYYPFLIYKILDIIIKDEQKKKNLLSCIHLQSYDTLIDNDRIWNLICQQNSCFEYRATDKIFFS